MIISNSEILIRLLVATALGAIIGLERERSHKVAGLRTHSLVSVGAALLSLISIFLFEKFPSVNGVTGFDYHLIANIIVGIGFIGGGAILRHGSHISGTTTAATLWVVSAIGIAAGIGFYYGAIGVAIISYFVLTFMRTLEKRFSDRFDDENEAMNFGANRHGGDNNHEAK